MPAPQPNLMLGLVLICGGLAHWLGWLLRVPSILLLLLIGFLAGPICGLIDPDLLLGDLLLPFVSFSVALILFEGGLTLNFSELRGHGHVVVLLVSVGALTTWVLSAAAGYWLIGLDFGLSVLLGAILTVTGPTVVVPLLRHLHITGPVNAILKWEGIVIDPIGAVLAVIAFEAIRGGERAHTAGQAIWAVAETLLLGGAIGLLCAWCFVLLVRKYWIPDHLHTLFVTILLIAAFLGSNHLLHESGLMAATCMGIFLANQKKVQLRHILEFKENLRLFLLSVVFVLLSARLKLADFANIGLSTIAFLAVLMAVVRPASVLLSTIGKRLTWRERAMLAWMAPRGIVAAAVTSVFALALEQAGHAQARLLVPIVFSVIVGTVLIYGVSGAFVARALGVANPNPQGLLFVGASPFARALAKVVSSLSFRVLMVDTSRENVRAANMEGLPTYYGSILAEGTLNKLDLAGIGRVLAMTSNDEVNTLATQRFAHLFGRAAVFQVCPKGSTKERSPISAEFHGRLLFQSGATLEALEEQLQAGAAIRATKLTQEFDLSAFRARYGETALPLILADAQQLTILVAGEKFSPRPGQTLINLSFPLLENRAHPPASQTAAAAG